MECSIRVVGLGSYRTYQRLLGLEHNRCSSPRFWKFRCRHLRWHLLELDCEQHGFRHDCPRPCCATSLGQRLKFEISLGSSDTLWRWQLVSFTHPRGTRAQCFFHTDTRPRLQSHHILHTAASLPRSHTGHHVSHIRSNMVWAYTHCPRSPRGRRRHHHRISTCVLAGA